MGRSRFHFGEAGCPHFLTCTVVGWLPVFTRPETVQILLDSWQFLQDQNRMTLLGYVVLENHIHFLASAENLPREVSAFKAHTARQVIDYLGERHVRTLLDGLEYHKARHKGDRRFQLQPAVAIPEGAVGSPGSRARRDELQSGRPGLRAGHEVAGSVASRSRLAARASNVSPVSTRVAAMLVAASKRRTITST